MTRPFNAEELRNLPLTEVAAALGAHGDSRDSLRWTFSSARDVYLRDDSTFTDWRGFGGSGAIDLASRILLTNYLDTIEVLRRIKEKAKPVIQETRRPDDMRPKIFRPPAPRSEGLQSMRAFLGNEHFIDMALVDRLNKKGLLYPDHMGNLVFITQSLSGQVTGAEIRTNPADRRNALGDLIPMFRYATNSKRDEGAFFVTSAAPASQTVGQPLVLVANAMEALALSTLKPLFTVVSLGDVINQGLIHDLAPRLLTLSRPIVASLPNTYAGREGSRILYEAYGWKSSSPNVVGNAETWTGALRLQQEVRRRVYALHRPPGTGAELEQNESFEPS